MMEPQTLRFGPHDLQEVLVWLPEPSTEAETAESRQQSRSWIILIHGGAWRDPTITHRTFAEPAVSILLSPSPSASPARNIQSVLERRNQALAIASLSYRLSSHPSYPETAPTTTTTTNTATTTSSSTSRSTNNNTNATNNPSYFARDARHPDHLDDICSALALLHETYGLTEDNYMLVGHSCGATLAFQALQRLCLSPSTSPSDSLSPSPSTQPPSTSTNTGPPPHNKSPLPLPVPPPTAIVGLAGIYDLRLLLDNHSDTPYSDIYASFLEGAFGSDKNDWDRASPARFISTSTSPDESKSKPNRTSTDRSVNILLVTADKDDLVEPEQRDVMRRSILGLGTDTEESTESPHTRSTCRSRYKYKYAEMNVEGGHDDMWQVGERMVQVIERALEM
ncbi:hypothetical protein HRR90_001333 [Exophiala dermatitidis]|uniref:Uncharacterized protein n=2 Tax=Exophiala dermatitidis TaxID=5970 RepID=H6BY42_EXODN|nr:uncharacterized protein HMPREF1120_05511 [Exophiala dermatitidis NIH/UT8656]KAJ4506816.1 hypothetical protein HRR73_008031 [Exophiala dermatitidis]EHY57478.1 hypothetical protein HMPREF1120_05511 [Exophiala dermatitidis NIH/UT8656]KAJ4520609.1 hypothetical protein HRR74_003607 [Exophiala dermatitidis]KAJ4537751.1 hypothetical protein HRR76_005739 [Exophiala dermatitidis]KAJ4551585.1 hypothetical protein HRR77_002819 [Exophiala dermatitidis]